MSSMIEAAFFGALGRDGELKTSKNGKPYLRLNIRVGDGDTAQWSTPRSSMRPRSRQPTSW
jgi:hypothetical protein